MTQILSLRDQLKALENLQELDLKLDQLKKKKADLPVALKVLEDAFLKAKASVDARQNSLLDLERVRREAQAALELSRDRAGRTAVRLENVANNTEYQAVSKELEQFNKANAALEEQILKAGTDIDAGRAELAQLEAALQKSRTSRDDAASEVQGRMDGLQAEIDKLGAGRAQYTAVIERRILGGYDRLRGSRGGAALVPAVSGRCSGCNMMLPPQQANDVQRGTALQTCPSCNRILFAPQPQAQA